MASSLSLPSTLSSTLTHPTKPSLAFPSSLRLPIQSTLFLQFPRTSLTVTSRTRTIATSFAYVSGPASDPSVSEPDPKFEELNSKDQPSSPSVVSWGLLWRLLLKHKLRLALCVVTLIGCTTCTLSMPILSGKLIIIIMVVIAFIFGLTCLVVAKKKRKLKPTNYAGRFFEVLIGARPEPLWGLLSTVGVLYALEPILTVIFVVNMNTIWVKVMSTLRAQIFGRLLIQKVRQIELMLSLSLSPFHII